MQRWQGTSAQKLRGTREDIRTSIPSPTLSQSRDHEADSQIVDSALRNLLSSFTGEYSRPIPSSTSPPPSNSISWNLLYDDTDIPLNAEEQAVANIASAILLRYDDLPPSDDEFDERSDDETNLEDTAEPIVTNEPANTCKFDSQHEEQGRKRGTHASTEETSKYWFPWHDRITYSCTSLVLVFSQRQLDLFLWLLKVNQVDDVPSVKSMQSLNAALQKMCGIETILYDGALGHKYYVNSLSQIIAQEMSNPKFAQLVVLSQDSGPKLSEARQGQRWLKELPDSQTTPMLRIAQQDYFIHEPAMLEWSLLIPTGGLPKRSILRQLLAITASFDGGARGWRVFVKSEPSVVPATDFLKIFPSSGTTSNPIFMTFKPS
ncbi:hypothetical protein MSAN_00755600 [Mycena sanguinolenta]|uniref:Uncharacterized protein n=1 Tax=Mycena sanguinolenta TaxID=230812 RepID=A0A8H7DH43_9AGAR|nr:hypothetical protein MSAN_00755600 [Mycena sanguinolenta]